MAFTDRFIKVPIKLYNQKEAELLGRKDSEVDQIEMDMRINVMEISDYWPSIPEENEFNEQGATCVRVVMKNAESHLVFLTIDEFEKKLDTWQNRNQ